MLRWCRRRLPKHRVPEPNRATRRALSRLTRPERRTIEEVTARLKRLPLQQRADVLARLPEWQRELLEPKL